MFLEFVFTFVFRFTSFSAANSFKLSICSLSSSFRGERIEVSLKIVDVKMSFVCDFNDQ